MKEIMVKRLGRYPLTIIGPPAEVTALQDAISYTGSESRWHVGVEPTEADRKVWLSESNQREVRSLATHGRYLADLHHFRAVYGYSSEYQEGWREKGAALCQRGVIDTAIEAYYEHCRVNLLDSGD